MVSYRIKIMVLGGMQTNCYLLYHEDTKEAVIVDPADEADTINRKISELSLEPKAILLTHGHFDHIQAVEDVSKRYKIPVIGHENAEEILSNPRENLSSVFGAAITVGMDQTVTDGQTLKLAGFEIQVLHTPGHTRDSVCYYLPQEGVLFSGDTLFAGSVGRTDFPGGSASQMMHSLREILLKLPKQVEVYPGHGEQTTIEYEFEHNPFV